MLDHVTDAARMDVAPDDFFGTGKTMDRRMALALINQRWEGPGGE
jgi:hypothetical protein